MILKTLCWTLLLFGSSLSVAASSPTPAPTPALTPSGTPKPSTSAPVPTDLSGVKVLEVGQGGVHQAGLIVYNAQKYGLPPAGGPHNPIWQNCGVYARPVANEYAVHALEHGVVWIAYRPGLPSTVIDKLRAAVRGNPRVILAPYPKLPAQVVATAWGVQKRYNSYGAEVGRFMALYSSEEGSKAPEFGATCQGGASDADSRQR